jgi:hypothetical protein
MVIYQIEPDFFPKKTHLRSIHYYMLTTPSYEEIGNHTSLMQSHIIYSI